MTCHNRQERRRHPRFPVAHNLAQVVSLAVKSAKDPSHQKTINTAGAVISDISAGGLALLTPTELPVGTEFEIVISLPSLKTKPIKCRVVRNTSKYDLNKIGIEFTDISPDDKTHINRIAEDYINCEVKLDLGVKDVCFKECHYYRLCAKDVKIHNNK